MKQVLTLIVILCLAALAAGGRAVAPKTAVSHKSQATTYVTESITIPQMLSYQGKLTDTLGQPVPDGNYALTFRLYTQPSGGSAGWTEAQTIPVKSGLFAALLGAVTPITSLPESGACYLSLQVALNPELSPRQRIVSAAYSYLAARAANADLLQGEDTTGLDTRYVNEAQANSVTGAMLVDGTVLTADVGDTAVTMVKLARAGATTGQVVKWTGSTWAPGADNTGGGSGVTDVYQDTGIICVPNPITSSGNIKLNLSYSDGRYVNTAGDSMTGALAVQGDLRVYGKGRLGPGNSNAGTAAFVAGASNSASGDYSAVAGGYSDTTKALYGGVLSGYSNLAGDAIDDSAVVIAGGWNNSANGKFNSIGGGYVNIASNDFSTIAGGRHNDATAACATVGGGYSNTAGSPYAGSLSGYDNNVGSSGSDTAAAIAAGWSNQTNGKYDFIGGGRDNYTVGSYATLGGGDNNISSNDNSTVSGGHINCANGTYATVGGGNQNNAQGTHSFVGGGYQNVATGSYSGIAGGSGDTARALFGAVLSGHSNLAGDAADDTATLVCGGDSNRATGKFNVIVGGYHNNASNNYSTLAGGRGNTVNGPQATVGGGWSNLGSGWHSVVAGGKDNVASGTSATVSGGEDNVASASWSSVAGGQNDTASGTYSTVGGGYRNKAGGEGASTVAGGSYNTASIGGAVGGGNSNVASDTYAFVGGGHADTASGPNSAVGGGDGNVASAGCATVAGGRSNAASGKYSMVPGGYYCAASGGRSFAAGSYALAREQGTFVWSDSCSAADSVHATVANRWVARARGGVYFFTNLGMTTGSYLAAGASSWNSVSDSMTKENFRAVDKKALLDALARMRVRDYNLKSQDASVRHIGPVAQDFHNAFGFGESNTAINMEDADGVLLAAVQALYEQNQTLGKRVTELEAKLGSDR